MARKLTVGGKPPQSGNKVSHSHRATRRKWLPNIQRKALYSVALDRTVRLTLPVAELRNVDRAGGLDDYLLKTNVDLLTGTMRRLQDQIRQRRQAPA